MWLGLHLAVFPAVRAFTAVRLGANLNLINAPHRQTTNALRYVVRHTRRRLSWTIFTAFVTDRAFRLNV